MGEKTYKGGYITVTKKALKITIAVVVSLAVIIGAFLLVNLYNYKKAVKLLKNGQYEEAYDLFTILKGFKDSPEKLVEVKKAMLKNAQPGQRIYFGSYYTGSDKEYREKKDIAWIVLEVKDGKAMLISEKNIDYEFWGKENFNDQMLSWEDSFLRNGLNNIFLFKAFSDEEIAKIADTVVVPDEDTHVDRFADALNKYERVKENEVVDKVFVLSMSEAMKYFPTDESRKSEPTEYTIQQNRYMEPALFHTVDLIHDETHSWWLRTRIDTVNDEHFICYVEDSGRIVRGSASNNHALRPVIWVSME